MKSKQKNSRSCKKYMTAAALLSLALILTLTGCGPSGIPSAEQPVEKQDFLLNTVCNLKLQKWDDSVEDPEALATEAFALARDLENKLSRTVEGSIVWQINHAGSEPIRIEDPQVLELLDLGRSYEAMTDGRFNIELGRLTALWNFSSGEAVVPSEEAIRAALNNSETHLDLGAIAKGYIVDQVRQFLKDNGVTRGIVDFGGNIACIGQKEDGSPWLIGIKKPVGSSDGLVGQNTTLGIVSVKPDGTAVTSGTYERKFEQDGVLYHHILDPATGYPCETDVASVTIVSTIDSADCDALSTICLLYGLDEGMELIESLPDVEAVFVTNDGEVHTSSGVEYEAL
ncbi:MAG: FAD:protein FMN transferase [Firmicutes bacterium]|nr:FAD:protein FMN transferase [Bacillota bacterium]